MINVTIGESKPQEKPFPKLMKHADGTITRFSEKGVGIHIYAPLHNCELWKEFKDIEMEGYTDFNESITLKNA